MKKQALEKIRKTVLFDLSNMDWIDKLIENQFWIDDLGDNLVNNSNFQSALSELKERKKIAIEKIERTFKAEVDKLIGKYL